MPAAWRPRSRASPQTSGTYLPDLVYANVGKFYAGTNLHHEMELLQDLAGGLVVTLPSEEDYRSAELGGT